MRLRGGPERTASSIEQLHDGGLKVEIYDFSDVAERHFGTDVAFILTVPPSSVRSLADTMGLGDDPTAVSDTADVDLLTRLSDRFASYFEIKAWLDEHAIPYDRDFDSWA